MNLQDSIDESEACIFIQGPSWDITTGLLRRPTREGEIRDSWASADFYGRWLLAAAKADAVWQKVKEEPRYKKQLERLPDNYFPAFAKTAFCLVSQLANESFSAIVGLNREEEKVRRWFLTMRQIGFFSWSEKHYEMRVPHQVSMAGTKNAVIASFRMNDRECCRRPEYSEPTMSYAEAKARQQRLREMRENYRYTEWGMQRLH